MSLNCREIDVIIVTFNRLKLLKSLLHSIFLQTEPVKNIIIYDDMSDDGTADYLKCLSSINKNIKIIRGKEKSKSVSASRNICLQISNAPFVMVLDDDDLIPKDKVTQTLDAFDDLETVAITGNSISFIEAEDKMLPHMLNKQKYTRKANIKDLRYGNRFHWVAFAFRRSALLEVGGFETQYRMITDWSLYLKLFEIGTIKIIPAILGYYRLHDTNFSKNADILVDDLEMFYRQNSQDDKYKSLDYLFSSKFKLHWQQNEFYQAIICCIMPRFYAVSFMRRFKHLISAVTGLYNFLANARSGQWSSIRKNEKQLCNLLANEGQKY